MESSASPREFGDTAEHKVCSSSVTFPVGLWKGALNVPKKRKKKKKKKKVGICWMLSEEINITNASCGLLTRDTLTVQESPLESTLMHPLGAPHTAVGPLEAPT